MSQLLPFVAVAIAILFLGNIRSSGSRPAASWFLSLRTDVLIALFVLWNVVGATGLYLNGGFGEIRSRESAIVLAIDCGLVSGFFLSTLLSGRFRELVTVGEEEAIQSRRGWVTMFGFFGLGFLMLIGKATGAIGVS